MRIRTDAEAVQQNVVVLLRADRFADALVPAALQAERLGVRPRSLTFLAEIVRRGGAAFAAGLPEPMPDQNQTHQVRQWLIAATGAPAFPAPPAEPLPFSAAEPLPPPVAGPLPPSAAGLLSVGLDVRLARWLDGVAALIEARRAAVAFS